MVWLGSQGVLWLLAQLVVVGFLVYFLLAYGDLFKRKIVRLSGDTLTERKDTVQLIDQITSPAFEPSHYEDEVRKRMQAAIDRKIQGQEIATAPEQPRAQIIDIMEALKASLAAKKGDLVQS